MKFPDFNNLLELMQSEQKEILSCKASEYATNEDRLHNFKQIANLTGLRPEQVAAVLMAKNIVALFDEIFKEKPSYNDYFKKEKIGDPFNYLVLIRALIEEKV